MVLLNTSDRELLKNLYNAFDPFRPLPAGDPTYVDCREVRGDGNILEDLGNRILLSAKKTCQLYSGHRGGGKSTELLKLKHGKLTRDKTILESQPNKITPFTNQIIIPHSSFNSKSTRA